MKVKRQPCRKGEKPNDHTAKQVRQNDEGALFFTGVSLVQSIGFVPQSDLAVVQPMACCNGQVLHHNVGLFGECGGQCYVFHKRDFSESGGRCPRPKLATSMRSFAWGQVDPILKARIDLSHTTHASGASGNRHVQ